MSCGNRRRSMEWGSWLRKSRCPGDPAGRGETREYRSEAKATPEFAAQGFVLNGGLSLYRGTHGFVCDDSMVPLEHCETREYRSEAKATPEFAA